MGCEISHWFYETSYLKVSKCRLSIERRREAKDLIYHELRLRGMYRLVSKV